MNGTFSNQTTASGENSGMFLNYYGIGFLTILTVLAPLAPLQGKVYAAVKEAGPRIGSEKWVEEKLRKYPELLWLADSRNALIPLESFGANAANQGYLSLSLFGKQSPEFDHAVRDLIYFHLFLDGSKTSYYTLNEFQKEPLLPFKQFLSLHKYFKRIFLSFSTQEGPDQSMRFFETSLILKEIGTSLKAQQIFLPYFSEIESKSFYKKALQVMTEFPELSPSYRMLSSNLRKYLPFIGSIANYEDMFTLNRVISHWEKFGSFDSNLVTFDLGLYFLDTCGKQGCYSPFFKDFTSFTQALRLFRDNGSQTAYYYYLTTKAKSLGFSLADKTEELLTRVATMMHCECTPIEGAHLKEAFLALTHKDMEVLTEHFFKDNTPKDCNIVGLESLVERLSPKLVGDSTKKERVAATLKILAEALSVYDEMISKNLIPQDTRLNFEEAVDICREIDLAHQEFSIRIHVNGLVNLII